MKVRPALAAALFPVLHASLALALSPGVESATMPLFFAEEADGTGLVLRSPAMTVQFQSGAVAYDLPGRDLRVVFPGGKLVAPIGTDQQAAKVNYFLGAGPLDWKPNAPTYAGVLYRDVWPGIDVAYSLVHGSLKSEFRIAPGASAASVQWSVQGADSVERESDGAIYIRAGAQGLSEAAPAVFQADRLTGELRPVKGAFRILSRTTVGIEVGPYDHRNRLIFDPVIGYSTYFGGSGQNQATSVVIDSNGDSIVAGYTTTLDLAPAATTFGVALRTTAFVAKFTAAGNQLIFALIWVAPSITVLWRSRWIAGTTSISRALPVRMIFPSTSRCSPRWEGHKTRLSRN